MTAQPPDWFTAALAAPAGDGTVEVAGARISYRAWGPAGAPGVVLVHGTAAHARWWDHIAPFLQDSASGAGASRDGGLRVAAISMSGHGDSDWRDHYGIDQWAAEVMAVAAAAQIAGPPVIIGHSLGGGVALATAGRYGGALAGIVVIDTTVYEGPPPPEMSTPEMGFGTGRTYPSREAIIARFRLVPEQRVLPYVREHIAAWSVADRGNGEWGWKFDQSLFTKMTPQAPPAAQPAGCRVTILRAHHGMMSPEMADRLRGRLGQRAPVVEIPAAGHHVLLDEPLSLVTALRTVLAGWTAQEPRDSAVEERC
ncbi:MAG: putative alpha/beta hydrolase [Actinomycetia bacterium]|nr:putative alpha/beta hydrolase [Actinomycetes bacterium]